jgi:hypothetical protein
MPSGSEHGSQAGMKFFLEAKQAMPEFMGRFVMLLIGYRASLQWDLMFYIFRQSIQLDESIAKVEITL